MDNPSMDLDDPNANKNQINESIHPIQGCPFEILQVIFEWTHKIAADRFKASTTLSHVCRRWRKIALRTPHLWTNVIVPQYCKREAVKAFWSRIVERVKIAPMTILTVLDGLAAPWPLMEEIPLDLFARITHLEFQLTTFEAANCLHSRNYRVPTCRVDHLEIRCSEIGSSVTIYTKLLDNFSALGSLTLDNMRRISWTPVVSIPTVTRLTMRWVIKVPFQSLVDTFPNIEELTLIGVRFLERPTDEIRFPKLRSLEVSGGYDAPWRYLKAPSLTHLIFSEKVTDDFLAFISTHGSIRHLDIEHSEQVDTIVAAAPQLEELTIIPCEELCDQDRIKLTNLRNLVLNQHWTYPLSVDLFDRIVQSWCLPFGKSNRKATKETEVIPSLTILAIGKGKLNKLEWRASSLLSSASEISKRVQRWDGTYYSYTFNWK